MDDKQSIELPRQGQSERSGRQGAAAQPYVRQGKSALNALLSRNIRDAKWHHDAGGGVATARQDLRSSHNQCNHS